MMNGPMHVRALTVLLILLNCVANTYSFWQMNLFVRKLHMNTDQIIPSSFLP